LDGLGFGDGFGDVRVEVVAGAGCCTTVTGWVGAVL
jgi:hypothetical protein